MDAENQPAWYKNSGETNKRNQFSYYLNAVRELAWNSSTNDFDEDFANEYRAYCNKKTLSAITPDMLSNIAMTYRSGYGEKDTLSYEECQVVGVVSTTNQQIAVASDDIYAILVDPSTEGEFAYAVAPMPKDKDTVRQLVEFYYTNTFNDGMVKFTLENSVTSELSMIDELLEVLGQVFLYVGLGFAVFASLMLSNFIATSISYKKQEIGILRAIGSRSRDVFMIFFAESFIIAMINFVLSVVATGVVVSVMNGIFREDVGLLITFLNFGIRQIVLLLGVSLIVALIATFLPVKKIASMKPIDAIKNRK
jgi:ABC-type antimicrobial peptide transport system permease subunit